MKNILNTMKKHQMNLRVVSCSRLSTKAVHIVLTSDTPLPVMLPGQFVQIQVPDKSVMLRRPISIHDVCIAGNTLHLLVQIVGAGTESLARVATGDHLNVVLPLGNGFPETSNKRVLLVGGGIGIAPLLYLARQLKKNGCDVEFLLGGKTAADLLRHDEYNNVATVHVTTEDGSMGEKGFVTNHSILAEKRFDILMVCGPTPMMKAVAAWAKQNSTECYVSLENMMACGLGACLCCVQKNTEGHNVCVCTEGPVFNIKQLSL